MAAVGRNSDGSYDAVDSGGFGRDYHGQDVFGERIGGTGIGGSHFGGFEEGHVGLDKDNTGHYEKLSSEALAQTESMSKSAFDADNSNESEEEANSDMRDSLRDLNSESSEENSKVGSLDTSFQIGGTEEDAKKDEKEKSWTSNLKGIVKAAIEYAKHKTKEEASNLKDKGKDIAEEVVSGGFLGTLANTVNDALDASHKAVAAPIDNLNKKDASFPDTPTDNSDWEKATSSFDAERAKEKEEEEKAKTESKAKVEETKTEEKAEPSSNMSSAKTSPSDYLTKANKDSTKEIPKEAPSRNDFGNHAVNTLKGVVDRVADSTTADALGIQSLEEFARENGYNPEKLSTMKAYQSYQNKQIMKAIPGIVKQIGSYITERVKDAVDPSQLPERIRNTLARYNIATLIGAAILSIQSGAGLQASIDQALTIVDPEDQAAVSDYLEDVLNAEGTVADLSNAFDDALAPEQNSDTAELDESIVNIGRKDNTDYSGFNAGLGTTSDADVKVFIARNIHSDPVLRRMISKMGK